VEGEEEVEPEPATPMFHSLFGSRKENLDIEVEDGEPVVVEKETTPVNIVVPKPTLTRAAPPPRSIKAQPSGMKMTKTKVKVKARTRETPPPTIRTRDSGDTPDNAVAKPPSPLKLRNETGVNVPKDIPGKIRKISVKKVVRPVGGKTLGGRPKDIPKVK
jgi:hypothetical protein